MKKADQRERIHISYIVVTGLAPVMFPHAIVIAAARRARLMVDFSRAPSIGDNACHPERSEGSDSRRMERFFAEFTLSEAKGSE
jgi:hypothetical protein